MAEKELKEVKEKANNLSEKKVDNFLESRKYKQTLPTNDCSFRERAKSYTNKNSCTISYYLLTCQIDKEFLKEIELVGGVNEIISKIIKLKDSSS